MTGRYGGQLAMFLSLLVIGVLLATVAKGQPDPIERPRPVPTAVDFDR